MFFFSACSEGILSSDIEGRWRTYAMEIETERYFNEISYFEFKEDGTFLTQIEFWKPSMGRWEIVNDSIFIITDKNELKGKVYKNESNRITLDVIQVNENNRKIRVELFEKIIRN